MGRAAVVAGIGGHLPSLVVTNAELATRHTTSDEWIRTRTGIRSRRRIEHGQSTSDLAVAAARTAIASTGEVGVGTIDLVIVATATPDRRCPATAPVVAHRLGLGAVAAFDVAAVCSGFLYALAVADAMVVSGVASTALVIGADTFSTIVAPDDRTTAAVFGDGAGAVVLRSGDDQDLGAIGHHHLGSDGGLEHLIIQHDSGSRSESVGRTADPWLRMAGQATYRHAVDKMSTSTRAALTEAGWAIGDVDLFVAHQANERILTAVGDELGIDPTRVFCNIGDIGNTAGASIPLALAEAAHRGALKPGLRVALAAFGGGATWGATTLTWPEIPDVQAISGKDDDATRHGS